jgi:Carboxypeptidase regulatory-like domain
MKRLALSPVGVALAVLLALSSSSVIAAEAPAGAGVVIGEVAVCSNSSEIPAPNVAVGVDGGQPDITRTDAKGQFSLTLAPGQYTIVATADDGGSASRFSVPVEEGQTLDVGTLDLNAGIMGCGFDADLPPVPLSSPTDAATPSTEGG